MIVSKKLLKSLEELIDRFLIYKWGLFCDMNRIRRIFLNLSHHDDRCIFVVSPCYLIWAPLFSIACCCTKQGWNDYKDELARLKLFEVLFESIPQFCLAASYLTTQEITISDFLPIISIIFSVIMAIVGTILGVKACCDSGGTLCQPSIFS